MSELMFDVGLAAKLKQAIIRNDIPDLAEVDWLCSGSNLTKIRRLRQGLLELTVPENLIDCDAKPFVWQDVSFELHRKTGPFKWDASKVQLWLARGQQNPKLAKDRRIRNSMTGTEVLREIIHKRALNANVLDFLMRNQHLIPEEWKGYTVYFWGTIYLDESGNQAVRFLEWDSTNRKWIWGTNQIRNSGWYDQDPAAVFAD